LEVANSLGVVALVEAPPVVFEDDMSAIGASSSACDPLMAAMPGVVHTAPLLTMVR